MIYLLLNKLNLSCSFRNTTFIYIYRQTLIELIISKIRGRDGRIFLVEFCFCAFGESLD